MIITDLYDHALVKPAVVNNAELFIVSGYASATFALRHLKNTQPYNTKINLIIGMPGRRNDHLAFVNLCNNYRDRFIPHYYQSTPPVHAKLYAWYSQTGQMLQGFSGSANYSQPGFFSDSQINQLTNESPEEIKAFYDSLLTNSVYIPNAATVDMVPTEVPEISMMEGSVAPGTIEWIVPSHKVRVSFLAKNGTLPQRSGLNWGQRPEVKREPNQAYLSLKGDSRAEGFLPPRAYTFTLITDDKQVIDCVVAQQGRKAIHSTENNSEIGIYIRNRIGVPLGEKITVADLERYGRTDFTLTKINEETFLLDLSV